MVAIRQNMKPARDPKIAVQEEFDAAMEDGSCEALQLFLDRHPESVKELAEQARDAIKLKKCSEGKG